MTKNNDERNDNHEDKQKRLTMKKNKKRNVSRLGGSGLSLNAFANAKSNNTGYNPSLIRSLTRDDDTLSVDSEPKSDMVNVPKYIGASLELVGISSFHEKQREIYNNAKKVKKYKKMLKQQNQQSDPSVSQRHIENRNETEEDKDKNERRRKKDSAFSLEELYKKQHEEKEKERMEREAVFKEKKEQREKAEARRKTLREKMFKKTRKGQPVMKYRIEHLLETIQASAGNKS